MSEVAEWFGDRAVLVCFADGERRAEVAARLAPALPGYRIRAGMDSVLVEAVDPAPGLLDDVRAALARLGAAVLAPFSPAIITGAVLCFILGWVAGGTWAWEVVTRATAAPAGSASLVPRRVADYVPAAARWAPAASAAVSTFGRGRDVFSLIARRRCGPLLVTWCRNGL